MAAGLSGAQWTLVEKECRRAGKVVLCVKACELCWACPWHPEGYRVKLGKRENCLLAKTFFSVDT